MVPLSVAALAQDPCVSSATAFRDPHVSFAYGGTADFRGRHNTLYNFLSAPGLAVNVKTEEAMFTLHDGSLTVNGTFLTEAHVVARISPQKVAQASFYSAELDRNGFGWQIRIAVVLDRIHTSRPPEPSSRHVMVADHHPARLGSRRACLSRRQRARPASPARPSAAAPPRLLRL